MTMEKTVAEQHKEKVKEMRTEGNPVSDLMDEETDMSDNNEPEGYGIIGGLNGAYLPNTHIGPFDTLERAKEALKEQHEQEKYDSWQFDDREVGELHDRHFIVERGERKIDRKVEIIELDEDLMDDWQQSP